MQQWQRIGLGATGVAVVFATGVGVGQVTDRSLDLEWRDGQGLVGQRMFTVDHDGWSYGARGAVPMWIDSQGSWHEGGWPDCLDAGATTVRFAAAPTTYVEGLGQRPVIAVDCRGTRSPAP